MDTFKTSHFFFFFWSFCLFRAAPTAYGGSQDRGPIGAVAAGLRHGHGNPGSELCLQPTPQLRQRQILNPLSEARDQTHNCMVSSQIHFHRVTMGTPTIDIDCIPKFS